MVVHAYNSSYFRGRGREITPSQLGQKHKTLLKKQSKAKGAGALALEVQGPESKPQY
jgi:hypothetical protein